MGKYEHLQNLYDDLLGVDFDALATHREQSEIRRIRILNEIVKEAERLRLSRIIYFAREAQQTGDITDVLGAIEEVL